jgi:hypothetical protein
MSASWKLARGAAAGFALAALGSCEPLGDTGYVEIRTVPVSAVTAPLFYLDTTKLDPIKKGGAVLRQPVGTTKLASDSGGGHLAFLCDIVVKKNRITTVTVSVLERPPRCQCRTGSGGDKSCVS